MTILEALQWAERELRATLNEKVTEAHHPKFDAQVLLARVLGKSNAYLFSHVDQILNAEQRARFEEFIARRKNHEPVAYILCEKAFYGRDFFVTPSVLIPRPDTELLIDTAKELARPDSIIIDVGTGSGAIAITTALEIKVPTIAIDISEDALSVARRNADTLKAASRITFLQGDLLKPYLAKTSSSARDAHGIILANLPYIRLRQWESLDPDVKLFEPKLALTAGIDGLDLYDRLFQQLIESSSLLPKYLDVLLEIDPDQATDIRHLVAEYFATTPVRILADLRGLARVVHIAIRP